MRLIVMALLLATISSPSIAKQVVIGDEQYYTKGNYVAWNSPWCRYSDPKLTPGLYNDVMSFSDMAFPYGTLISWSMPTAAKRAAACPVYGYMALSFGNYDGGTPATSVTPLQVKNISQLLINYHLAITGTANDFDILQEFYLTSAKGNASAKVIEIGWFLHTPVSTLNFVRAGKQIGTYVSPIDGKSWVVAKNGTFVTFMPTDTLDTMIGTMNIRDALIWLKAKGVITGEEWFNGMAVGAEPLGNAGSMVVTSWKVNYH